MVTPSAGITEDSQEGSRQVLFAKVPARESRNATAAASRGCLTRAAVKPHVDHRSAIARQRTSNSVVMMNNDVEDNRTPIVNW